MCPFRRASIRAHPAVREHLAPFIERGAAAGILDANPTVYVEKTAPTFAELEEPLARQLFSAGGVEVLDAFVAGGRRRTTSGGVEDVPVEADGAPPKVLIQSMADVFFYTGHGSGRFGVPFDDKTGLAYAVPEDLLVTWPPRSDLRILVLHGCNILMAERDDERARVLGGSAFRWSSLVRPRPAPEPFGGPTAPDEVILGPAVDLILGYWQAAPRDFAGGTDVGTELGETLARDFGSGFRLDDLREDWLAKAPGGKAAIDASGYYFNHQQPIPPYGVIRVGPFAWGPFTD
jgi:hypothetical protein